MRICIVYDGLFPWNVGGAERWYRSLAEGYAAAGYEVTYLTIRRWPKSEPPRLEGVRVVGVAPPMKLYSNGKRRILPPVAFGIGVFLHLLTHLRRYDLVHTASFPFFSLLAAGVFRPVASYRIMVDWHEVWTREYWRKYLGSLGDVGWWVQRLCAKIPQTAFSFSRLHQARAAELVSGPVTLLEGEYSGDSNSTLSEPADPPEIVYAGRLIPEKRVGLLVDALGIAMAEMPSLIATIIGDGPDFGMLRDRIIELGLADRIGLPGFVSSEELEVTMSRAAAIVQPSEREGYGLVVIEAVARSTPVIVVPGIDNAATELVEDGINGLISVDSTSSALSEAILRVCTENDKLRRSTRAWYDRNRTRLSFKYSLQNILRHVYVRNC